MSKNDQLDELFEKWMRDHEISEENFVKEGIIHEPDYDKQRKEKKPKLLFICKEMNDPKQRAFDFREVWKDPDEKKYLLATRIAHWAYGIQNGFPIFDDVLRKVNTDAEKSEILKSIAFMNLKKIPGENWTNIKEIREVVAEQHKMIFDEIEIIRPDIIIGGMGKNEIKIWESIFSSDKIKLVGSGHDVWTVKHKSYKIINYHHPSNRGPHAALYYLLRRVYKSGKF
ncbi:MAG: hypothetical protein MPK62_14040 [Alphaproteobacteria bacterium]|nr:hypothetical protein [Alphaproteobacteria bacterium]MDA8032216.1 hypothetical protein [Alphaproteobacteria bacterium]